jgi:hypothetical protein
VVAMSDEEVALRADIPITRIKEISTQLAWGDIPIDEARDFCSACNFDIFNSADRNRAGAYLRKGAKFLYLKSSPYWKSTFLPLINIMKESNAEERNGQHSRA